MGFTTEFQISLMRLVLWWAVSWNCILLRAEKGIIFPINSWMFCRWWWGQYRLHFCCMFLLRLDFLGYGWDWLFLWACGQLLDISGKLSVQTPRWGSPESLLSMNMETSALSLDLLNFHFPAGVPLDLILVASCFCECWILNIINFKTEKYERNFPMLLGLSCRKKFYVCSIQ